MSTYEREDFAAWGKQAGTMGARNEEIKRRHAAGESKASLAREFGIAPHTVSFILDKSIGRANAERAKRRRQTDPAYAERIRDQKRTARSQRIKNTERRISELEDAVRALQRQVEKEHA